MNLYQRLLMSFGKIAPQRFRNIFFRIAGMKIGDRTRISGGFYVDRPEGVTIGNHCFFNLFVHLHNGGDKDTTITFGDNVFVGPNVSIVCASHQIGSRYQRAGKNIYGSIVIEDGVWIGAGEIILPGVIISRGGVIGAGTVVVKSTEPNHLYLGVPAKKVKDLDT